MPAEAAASLWCSMLAARLSSPFLPPGAGQPTAVTASLCLRLAAPLPLCFRHLLAGWLSPQAMYEEVRAQLASAAELSAPTSKAALQAVSSSRGGRQAGPRPRVRMFMALDFEWWEKSSQTILEVGWSLWDTATQRHRTRHWIIRENLNKVRHREGRGLGSRLEALQQWGAVCGQACASRGPVSISSAGT